MADHQPPNKHAADLEAAASRRHAGWGWAMGRWLTGRSLAPAARPRQQFYPHCATCSSLQGGAIAKQAGAAATAAAAAGRRGRAPLVLHLLQPFQALQGLRRRDAKAGGGAARWRLLGLRSWAVLPGLLLGLAAPTLAHWEATGPRGQLGWLQAAAAAVAEQSRTAEQAEAQAAAELAGLRSKLAQLELRQRQSQPQLHSAPPPPTPGRARGGDGGSEAVAVTDGGQYLQVGGLALGLLLTGCGLVVLRGSE